MLFGAVAGDINLVAMLASVKKLSGAVVGDINLVATLVSVNTRPIKQKLRRFAKDRKQAIEVELCKLLAA
jgi:hypothetical protein